MKYKAALFALVVIAVQIIPVQAARLMENLDRGVVGVRTGTSTAFMSWRLLGTDPSGIGFNVYRATGGGAAVKRNGSVLTGGTCYSDTSVNFSLDNVYHVRPVIDGVEQTASGSYTLKANATVEPCIVVPLSSGNMDTVHFVWVGDLDGDGEYDFVVDRINSEGRPQKVEAYKRDGTFLWSIDLGVNSTNTYNIEPGSSCIDVGHWDGVTVYDLDSDGRAEVMIRTANGVTFGDEAQLTDSNNDRQYISVLDGMTGAERARILIPTDYIADGPMGAQLGVGYLNGSTPSLVAVMKNRIGSGDFNMMVCAWDFHGSSLTQKWKWLRGSQNCPDGHQMRIVDVDGDGKDEVCEIGFVLRGTGTLFYTLGTSGVVHGDRWHIGKFDPSRAGLQGYGIQQDNASGLYDYYYDAATGAMIWTHMFGVSDVARGDVGDIDPDWPGFECWAFAGVYNLSTNTQLCPSGNDPWPCLRLWWDGDELAESYNDGKIEKYDPDSTSTGRRVVRLVSTWDYETATRSDRGAPMFYGDLFGDWREEAIHTSSDYSKLVIFTTNVMTSRRLYTLAHNPEYRNSMTVKGYIQSHQLDYYLGSGMTTPPAPDIVLVGGAAGPVPDPMTWASAPSAAGATSIAMTATTATSSGGVEYYFACTAGGGHNSGWQTGTTYADTGLAAGGTYTYTVQARDATDTTKVTSASPPATVTLSGSVDTIYEAENTTLSGAVVANNQSGYSGTGFADYQNATGDYVEWTVAAATETNCGLTFRYALAYAGTDRPLEIRVNGVVVAASLSFPSTGSWTVWTLTSPLAATLHAGANTVRATAIGYSGANVDYMKVSVAAPDTTPPWPSPMTWAAVPAATSHDTITMTATTASDASGVEYYFANLTVTDMSHDSGWQDSPAFADTGLTNGTTYTYAMAARDKSPQQNMTEVSTEESATTLLYTCQSVPASDMSSDCRVDFADFAMFAGEFLAGGAGSTGNFNGDGLVDFGDLAALTAEWLQCGREPATECP